MLIEKKRVPVRDILLFGFWPSFIKVFLYRLLGYRIGKGVSIGFGSVLCAEQVEVGDHTEIGFLTIIRGKQIRIGSHVQIRSTTFLDTPYIEIGEGSRINEQVFVGGLQQPDSRFVLGRNCQVMQMTFINPAQSVIVGDDSGIGGHSLIFGHSSWQSQFEGYPVSFQPIEIGKSVSLAWRVFVMPGSNIGDGAVVGVNSLVHGNIPPRSLAVGYPARVVSKAPDFPKEISDEEKVVMFGNIVGEMIRYFSASGLTCSQDGNVWEIRKPGGGWWWSRKAAFWRLHIADGNVRDTVTQLEPQSNDVFLSLHEIPSDIRSLLRKRNVMWIEIANKEQSTFTNDLGDEVLLFLRRYGVRTLRAPGAAVSDRRESRTETSSAVTDRPYNN